MTFDMFDINCIIMTFICFLVSLGNNSNKSDMDEVDDASIKDVDDVTEDCNAKQCTFDKLFAVEQFLESNAENRTVNRY